MDICLYIPLIYSVSSSCQSISIAFSSGEDRFRVWSEEGRYWCRGCGKAGDSIQYLRACRGPSFVDACAILGHDPGPQKDAPPPEPVKDWRYGEDQIMRAENETDEALAKRAIAQVKPFLAKQAVPCFIQIIER